MKINPYKSKARYVSTTGLMLALACVLTALESVFSAFLPAGMRIGLSNIVIMAACAAINLPTAFIIVLLKGVFVFATRGATAGIMSLCGGIISFAAMGVLFSKTKASYILISVVSALLHTVGQLSAAVLLTGSVYTFFYAPVLCAVSVASGICTGFVLGQAMPHLIKALRRA